jgi:hypothetical protein
MTLEEAIKNFEQKIDEFERLKKIKAVTYEDYAYIEKTRQLAKWLRELKRADTLLKATYDLLSKQYEDYYVLNLLAETVYYDEAECDGNCLMEDIDAWMDERGIDHDATRN